MRRFLIFFLALQITVLMLAGCSIPFFGKSPEASDKTGDMDLIGLDGGPEDHGNMIPDPGTSDPDGQKPDTGSLYYAEDDIYDADAVGNKYGPGGTLSEDDTGGVADSVFTAAPDGYGNGYPDDGYYSGAPGETESRSTDSYDNEDHDTGPYGTGVLSAQKTSGVTRSEPRRPVTVYYQDADGCIIPMTRWIQSQPGIARAAVSLAIDSPLTREETAYYGVYPVIPENTEILGIDIRNGTAVIDFSRHLLNYGTAWSERNIIAAIVYTLTEFETVDDVRILINGYSPGVLKYGTDLSDVVGREDLMINAGPSLSASGNEKLDVYFMKQANERFSYAVPVSLAVDGEADMMPDTFVRLLFGTKPGGGIYTEIPDGADLKSSYVHNGTVYLDFSKEFLDYGGALGEEAILKQITYTLRQCDGIRKINITVEGRSTDLPEGTYISAGLVIPATINDVMDRG